MVLVLTVLTNEGLTCVIMIESCNLQKILYTYHTTTIHQHSFQLRLLGEDSFLCKTDCEEGTILPLDITWPHMVPKAKVVAKLQLQREVNQDTEKDRVKSCKEPRSSVRFFNCWINQHLYFPAFMSFITQPTFSFFKSQLSQDFLLLKFKMSCWYHWVMAPHSVTIPECIHRLSSPWRKGKLVPLCRIPSVTQQLYLSLSPRSSQRPYTHLPEYLYTREKEIPRVLLKIVRRWF